MIQPILLEKLGALPESLQNEVLDFIDFLSEKYKKNQAEVELPKKKRGGLGILRGKIWMADDFDEPLEEMKEYM
jgi:hypothetical protein